MNITEPIWRSCHAYPDRIALVVDGKKFSYRNLLQMVLLASARPQAFGLRNDEEGRSMLEDYALADDGAL